MSAKDEKFLTGTTSTGFSFSVDKRVFDDYENLELLDEIEESNPLALVRYVKRILGEDQKNKLIDHVRDDEGFVSSEKMVSEIVEIMNAFSATKDGKN